ncbi:MAG: hypothetical protein QOF24_2749 [Verrucomicrobiota bacterium]|jgi:hypothetical protein
MLVGRALPALARTPVVWLNLVCLDAPIVAVIWLWLFAQTFQMPAHVGNAAALFLTAWFIYLSDRLADAASLTSGSPRSLRQEFCVRHREVWIVALFMIGGLDAYVIWHNAAAENFLVGAAVGLLALVYLLLNHPLGRIWRFVPLKEFSVGFLFAAGTLVALLPALPPLNAAFVLGALAFASLCTLNCISIACWERELDEAQRKISMATRHPSLTRHVTKICALLAFASFVMAIACPAAAPILGSISLSALLLAWLNASTSLMEGRFRKRRSLNLDRDQRTALADLVLLTPIIPLLIAAL